MANNNQESNRKSSKRSKGKQNKRRTLNGANTINQQTRENTTNTNKGGFQRMDGGMERVPSNAPTMAIAPSDYEHIFHEATGAVGGQQVGVGTPPGRGTSPSPPQVGSPPPPPMQQQQQPLQLPPMVQPPTVPTLPPPPMPRISRTPEAQNYQLPQQRPEPPLVVTPDGYAILGQSVNPNTENHRRIALPAHIVRASNQFSRAALARVSRYLASRAEPPR